MKGFTQAKYYCLYLHLLNINIKCKTNMFVKTTEACHCLFYGGRKSVYFNVNVKTRF